MLLRRRELAGEGGEIEVRLLLTACISISCD